MVCDRLRRMIILLLYLKFAGQYVHQEYIAILTVLLSESMIVYFLKKLKTYSNHVEVASRELTYAILEIFAND